jgi:hypothetical protein
VGKVTYVARNRSEGVLLDDQHLDTQQRPHILDPAKVVAGGAAAPLGALLTSHFGVAGTMLGLALSAVIVTTISDILKAYFKRAPGAVKNIPGSLGTGFSLKNFRRMVTAPFSWFLSLGPSRRRAMLLSGLLAGVVAFLIGTGVVTALEVGVGENLSCWVWNECPTTDSSSAEEASNTRTLPSILGGGQSLVSSSNTPQEGQQPTAGSQSSSSQSSGTPAAKAPVSSRSGQQEAPSEATPGTSQSRQQTPSGIEEQQQSSPTRVVEEQQQSSSGAAGEQQSSSSSSVTQEQQQSPSSIPDNEVVSPQDNSSTPQP